MGVVVDFAGALVYNFFRGAVGRCRRDAASDAARDRFDAQMVNRHRAGGGDVAVDFFGVSLPQARKLEQFA